MSSLLRGNRSHGWDVWGACLLSVIPLLSGCFLDWDALEGPDASAAAPAGMGGAGTMGGAGVGGAVADAGTSGAADGLDASIPLDAGADAGGSFDMDAALADGGQLDAGAAGQGGANLDAGTDAGVDVCVPTGPEGPENCSDGIDNDCDGFTDCPIATPEHHFPEPTGAAAGADVRLAFLDPSTVAHRPVGQLMCRTAKRGQIEAAAFEPCVLSARDGGGLYVHPIDAVRSQEAARDGLTVTEVRIAYEGGGFSETVAQSFYVHHSLHGVPHCAALASDAAYFARAAERLLPGGMPAFAASDVQLANPFVSIDFDPPTEGSFQVSDGDGRVELLSLRRRFVLDPNRELLLMTRVYEGRSTPTCKAGHFRSHVRDLDNVYRSTRFFLERCDAIVLNKKGAGVCLTVADGSVAFWAGGNQWMVRNLGMLGLDAFFIQGADNFMWRKLMRRRNQFKLWMFSSKCDDLTQPGCGEDHVLFLPDRHLFP